MCELLMLEFSAGLLVGSLEILGSPTGLVRSIGNGVADMFSMPYRGLTRGPGQFISGVRQGTGSLLWHLSTGFMMKLLLIYLSLEINSVEFCFCIVHYHIL